MGAKMKKELINQKVNYKEAPDLRSIMNEAEQIAAKTVIGETLFMKKYGVKSEAEYKEQMVKEHKIMKHSQIGWNSWEDTQKGFRYIYEELNKSGSRVDRFGICIDWVMGVPEKHRSCLTPGTGLIFKSPDEWKAIGQIVPIQIHMGDHMIGSLNSLENTQLALEAGVTSIGNVSQYYTYEYPGVDLEKNRVGDMMRAIALMGKFREKGTIIHSNLDDGFGSQFKDLTSVTGWAMMERYLVEDLLGGGLSHCFGNLFSDPIVRIAFNQAMMAINKTGTYGSMIYGNTTDFGFDLDRNYGALASFMLGDMIGQLHNPSGHAIAAIPITEAVRIPSPEEIVQVNLISDTLIEKAPYYEMFMNWDRIEEEKEILVNGGKFFFERMMNALDDLDIDIKEPGQMFVALKNIGSEQLERNFGAGKENDMEINGRIPVRPTDIVKKIRKKQEEIFLKMGNVEESLKGVKIILAATDVHEFGKIIIGNILKKAGATVYDLGANVTVDEIIETMYETESQVITVSTYNGIALSYAKRLKEKLEQNNLRAHIKMGGLLNENLEGGNLAVDVTEEIRALGINCDNQADQTIEIIKQMFSFG